MIEQKLKEAKQQMEEKSKHTEQMWEKTKLQLEREREEGEKLKEQLRVSNNMTYSLGNPTDFKKGSACAKAITRKAKRSSVDRKE
jgi:hypothetical protein